MPNNMTFDANIVPSSSSCALGTSSAAWTVYGPSVDTSVAASGNKLLITDSTNKIVRSNIEFDGSTNTKALTQKGTWESMVTAAGNASRKIWVTDSLIAPSGSSDGDIVLYEGSLTPSDINAVPETGNNGILIRNNNIVGARPFYTLLYDCGQNPWIIGDTQEIEGFSNYHLFLVKVQTTSTGESHEAYILAILDATGTSLNGIGGYTSGAKAEAIYVLNGAVSGNYVSLVQCHTMNFSSGSLSSTRTVLDIVQVYGLL